MTHIIDFSLYWVRFDPVSLGTGDMCVMFFRGTEGSQKIYSINFDSGWPTSNLHPIGSGNVHSEQAPPTRTTPVRGFLHAMLRFSAIASLQQRKSDHTQI